MLTSGYTSKGSISRTEDITTSIGFYRVPKGVCALLVDISSINEINIVSRSGNFCLVRREEQGWKVIAVEDGDTLIGNVQLYEYR